MQIISTVHTITTSEFVIFLNFDSTEIFQPELHSSTVSSVNSYSSYFLFLFLN